MQPLICTAPGALDTGARAGEAGGAYQVLLELGDYLVALLHLLQVQLLLARQVGLQLLHRRRHLLLLLHDLADHVVARLLLLDGRRERRE